MTAADFLNDYPTSFDEDRVRLHDPQFRESIYQILHPRAPRRYHPLLKHLLEKEVEHRSRRLEEDPYFENLYWVALLLYQIGDLDDVMPLWNAKQIDMDTRIGLDVQFLIGAGVDETIQFLRMHRDPRSKEAADFLEKCRVAGDFDHLEEWLRGRIAYFN